MSATGLGGCARVREAGREGVRALHEGSGMQGTALIWVWGSACSVSPHWDDCCGALHRCVCPILVETWVRAHLCAAAVQHQASLCLCWQWCGDGWPVVLVVCAACCTWSVLDILLPSCIAMLVGFVCAGMQRLSLGAMLPRASLLQELLQKHIVCTVRHGEQAAHCACSESAVGQPVIACHL